MSLLGSIFGSDAGASRANSKSQLLFDKSEELPDRPQHKPITKIKRQEKNPAGQDEGRQKKTIPSNDAEDSEQPVDDANRKDRKKRKTNRNGNDKDDSDATSAKKKRKEPPPGSKNSSTKDGGGDDKKDETEEAHSSGEQLPGDGQNIGEEERTIFVGNLPLATTTRKSLTALFKDCGPVASARIRSVPVKGVKLPQDRAGDQRFMKKVCVNTNQVDDSLKNTVQGYVVFKDVESVDKALAKNSSMVVDGMRLRIDRATPTVDASRSVFVGNLPYGAEEATLQQHFVKGCDMETGDVQGVRIVRDKETFQCKGFGYILLREKSMVPAALKLTGSSYMHKPLRVMVCGKRFKGKQGDRSASNKPKNSSSAENGEKVTVGAFRRIIAKQQKDSVQTNKRKRGEKKKGTATKAAAGGGSKRAALEKKVDKRVKKLEKRVSKGMGKTRRS